MNSYISIIVPVFNSEEYLEACIVSILEQTYTYLEIILINDGSTDLSLSICQNFAKKDERIIVINQKNYGQAVARNKGLEIATGKYIAFVDSDDTISNDLFYENIKIIESDPELDFVQFPRMVNYGTLNIELINTDEEKVIYKESLYKSWLEDKIVSWVVWDKLYRKELFYSLRFQENMIYEDNYLIADILSDTNKIYISNKGTYNYWYRSNSTTTQTHSYKKDLDTLKVSLNILNRIKNIDNTKSSKIIILSRIFFVYESIYRLFKVSLDIDNLFVLEFRKIHFFSFLKSNLPIKQKIKLSIIQLIGLSYYFNYLKKNKF